MHILEVNPMERAGKKPHVEIFPPCPRCGSSNTKFCYYNNYSLTQPRYFCKGCRRYWTKGGSLRNVPIGGGCRKTRRGGRPFRDVISMIPAPPLHCRPAGGGPLVNSTIATTTTSLSPSSNSNSNSNSISNASLKRSSSDLHGSNIDLALVYANFLNQKPWPPTTNEADHHVEGKNNYSSPHHSLIEEIPLMFPNSVCGGHIPFQFPAPLFPQENGFVVEQCTPQLFYNHQSPETTQFSTNAFNYLSGLDSSIEKLQTNTTIWSDFQFISSAISMENHQQAAKFNNNNNNNNNNHGLPPIILPGDDHEELNSTIVSEGLDIWADSSNTDFFFPSLNIHATQLSAASEESSPNTIAAQPPPPPKQIGENNPGTEQLMNMPIQLCNVLGL